jgi:hypothetical protein
MMLLAASPVVMLCRRQQREAPIKVQRRDARMKKYSVVTRVSNRHSSDSRENELDRLRLMGRAKSLASTSTASVASRAWHSPVVWVLQWFHVAK